MAPPTQESVHGRFDEHLQQIRDGQIINLTPAGLALQRFARAHGDAVPGCGFMDGGCWVLAEALNDYLIESGVGAHLVGVGRAHHLDHVVVSIAAGGPSPLYADADGVGSLDDMLDKMRLVEHVSEPTLVPFSERQAHLAGLTRFDEIDLRARLARELRASFGDRLARHLRHWPTHQRLVSPPSRSPHP